MLGRGDAKRNHAWILLSMLSVNLGSSRRSYVIFALHFGYLMDVSYFNYLTITLLKAKSYFYTLNNIYHQQSFAPVRHRNDFITQIMKDKINLFGDWIVFLCVIISRLWFKKKKNYHRFDCILSVISDSVLLCQLNQDLVLCYDAHKMKTSYPCGISIGHYSLL